MTTFGQRCYIAIKLPEYIRVNSYENYPDGNSVTWRFVNNGTHVYLVPITPPKSSNFSTPVVNGSSGKVIYFDTDERNKIKHRYFFTNEDYSKCADCIAVGLQMNITFERALKNPSVNTFICHPAFPGSSYCEKEFQKVLIKEYLDEQESRPLKEYIWEWNTSGDNSSVVPGYVNNVTRIYQFTSEDYTLSMNAPSGSSNNDTFIFKDELKKLKRRYFFADEELSRCAECIAVALQMNITFELLVKNPRRNNFKYHGEILGPSYCKEVFQNYAHRVVDDIYFIGPKTISSMLVDDIYNKMIPNLLSRECSRYRSFLLDEDLYTRWFDNNFDMIRALCRCERGPLASCTMAGVDYNPRELGVEVNWFTGFWQIFIDLIAGRHVNKRLTEEYKILKAWHQNWN